MHIRHLAFLALILSVLSALADKKMTILNSDTGHSFEATPPDRTGTLEHNSEWLDSVPYLLERARYGDSRAYEALGNCHRYGKGGVERSILKAVSFYELAGVDIEQMALEALKENPTDQFGNTFRLLDIMRNGDKESVLCFIDTLHQYNLYDTDNIRNIICDTDSNARIMMLERYIMDPKVSTDQMTLTLIECMAANWLPDSFRENDRIVTAICDKLPALYDAAAVIYFKGSREDLDSATIKKKNAKATTFLERADRAAVLSRKGAEYLYRYYLSEIEAGRRSHDVENMERLATIARLPESERVKFTN